MYPFYICVLIRNKQLHIYNYQKKHVLVAVVAVKQTRKSNYLDYSGGGDKYELKMQFEKVSICIL